jgi:hypothetical protein
MFGGVAGYRPRVRSAYYERVYVHSPRRDISNIGAAFGELKWLRAKGQGGLDAFDGAVRAAILMRNT